MATEYSIQKMVSDGTLSTIALGIQYLQRNDIYIRIAGEETPQSGAPSGYTWSFINNTTLKILPVVPNGVEVVVYRRTDVDAMHNIYSQNAQFDEATIDENNQQLLYIAQEYLEQGIPGAGVDSLIYLYTSGGLNYYRFSLTDGSYTDPFPVPDGTDTLRAELKTLGGSGLIGDLHSVTNKDFAGGAVPDGTTLNDAAFLAAVAAANKTPIYVPKGVFRLSTPYVLPDDSYFYGPGILKFDLAEHRRRGGSSGSVSIPERYTLFYEFASQSDVSVKFNGEAQPITWVTTYTVEAPGSLVTDQVVIGIVNGTLQLGDTPQSIKVGNSFAAGIPSELAITAPDAGGWFGTDCTSMGAKAMMHQKGGVNNSAFGSRALFSVENGHNNCAFGFQALYRASGSNNTAMGSIAGEWITTGYSNTLIGGAAGGKVVTGYQNTALGHFAYGESQGGYANVAIGYRAMGNSGDNNPVECVAVGYSAGDFAYGGKNTFVGYRAGCGPNSGTDGAENTFMGFFAGRNQNGADFNVGVGVSALVGLGNGNQNTAIGHSAAASVVSASGVTAVGYQALTAATVVGTAFGYKALASMTTGLNNTAFGYQALANVTTGDSNTAFGNNALRANTGVQNTAVGQLAMDANTSGSFNTAVGFEAGRFANDGNNNSSVGFRAGRATTGNDNTSVGANALTLNTTGVQNTALGSSALKVAQDLSNQTTFNNTTGVGFNASVSGSNQVQLGNSATTTYVYGTVQNRSDARDKTDVRDTQLGIDFIMGLRPVDGRWDLREDYWEEYDEQVGVDAEGWPVFETKRRKLPKDGSKKRERFHHWFIAQEVKELCDSLGVEFGGYQDHSVNGGCDVLSLGYDEFIPPTVKAVQQCWTRLDELEKRIANLEN